MDIIPVAKRACDLCSDVVTDGEHTVCKSFVLTDWGVICVECWDNRIQKHREFEILFTYVSSQTVEDEWINRPMVLASWDEMKPLESALKNYKA